MRITIALAALLLTGCNRSADFDERYAAAQRRLEAKSAGIDHDLAAASSDAAGADPVATGAAGPGWARQPAAATR